MPYQKLEEEVDDSQINNARATSTLNPYPAPYSQPTANFAPVYSHNIQQQQPPQQELQYYSPPAQFCILSTIFSISYLFLLILERILSLMNTD